MPTIHARRLRLVSLARDELALLVRDAPALARGLGLHAPSDLVSPPVRRAIAVKLLRMASAPERDHPWHTYWLIRLRDEPQAIGLVGFKGAPDRDGRVEIGYGLGAEFRGRGYMTEAVTALLEWAFAQPGCRAVLADTDVANRASQRVLVGVGMSLVGATATGMVWQLRREDWPGAGEKGGVHR